MTVDDWLLGCLALLGIGAMAWRVAGSRRRRALSPPVLPSDLSLASQPLLTEDEAALYNLLRVAVGDHYLIFSQVPLWSFLEASEKDRAAFLKAAALRRADFVLVHPGSRKVELVLEIAEPGEPSLQRAERNRVVDTMLAAAHIEVVRLSPADRATVESLRARLGFGEEE